LIPLLYSLQKEKKLQPYYFNRTDVLYTKKNIHFLKRKHGVGVSYGWISENLFFPCYEDSLKSVQNFSVNPGQSFGINYKYILNAHKIKHSSNLNNIWLHTLNGKIAYVKIKNKNTTAISFNADYCYGLSGTDFSIGGRI